MNNKEIRDNQRREYNRLLDNKMNGEITSFGGDEIQFFAPIEYLNSFKNFPLKAPIPLAVINKNISFPEFFIDLINVKCLVANGKIFGDKNYYNKILKNEKFKTIHF